MTSEAGNTVGTHTHSDKKDTLTGLEAWLLMCSEAVQHVNMFLGVCLFVFVNVCVGSMRESVRGAEEKTHKKPPTEHRGNSSRISGLATHQKNQQRDQECMQIRAPDPRQTGEKNSTEMKRQST